MRRREFIALVGGAAVWPVTGRAQPAKKPARIGLLPLGSPSDAYDGSLVKMFRHCIAEAGLADNRDVIIDVAWIAGAPEPTISKLIERGIDLLVPRGSSAAVAARRQTLTIPIVFIGVGDPIRMGLVDSLSRPGGNATGFSDVLADLSGKYVEIARELRATQAVGYLWHTRWPDGQYRYQATEQAAAALGMTLQSRGMGDLSDVELAINSIKESGAAIVIVQPSPFVGEHRTRIIDLAMRRGLGTIFGAPKRDGALAAYGPDYGHMYCQAAAYVARILEGAKPADLPVQEPARFALMINLKTAKALGLAVPPTLLSRADEVIE